MIYLDNNATTKVAPEALTAMMPFFTERFQNPGSVAGEIQGIRRAIANSRRATAQLVGTAEIESVVFTSGATESNNWAISSAIEVIDRPHLITSSIEHPSVTEPMKRLEKLGCDLTVVPVMPDGTIDIDAFTSALRKDTGLVAIIAANNETGVIQPIATLAEITKRLAPKAWFHADATQLAGKSPIKFDDNWVEVDSLSLSGHKFHGPKGMGALVYRGDRKPVPLLLGGNQEDGSRSGTTNVPGVVGMGAAAQLVSAELERKAESIACLRDDMEAQLKATFPDVVIHGATANRLPNTSCFSLPGCEGNHLAEVLGADNLFVGTGAACSSGALHPPKTLLAMGVTYALASASLRVSLSRYSTNEDVHTLIRLLHQHRPTATKGGN